MARFVYVCTKITWPWLPTLFSNLNHVNDIKTIDNNKSCTRLIDNNRSCARLMIMIAFTILNSSSVPWRVHEFQIKMDSSSLYIFAFVLLFDIFTYIKNNKLPALVSAFVTLHTGVLIRRNSRQRTTSAWSFNRPTAHGEALPPTRLTELHLAISFQQPTRQSPIGR